MKAWLVFYNLASAAGWAYVLFLALTCLSEGKTPAEAWAAFGPALMIVQSTMAFEILHAAVGMVRSPLFVTFMQVSSRLWVVWGATFYVQECQEHWSLYLMVISWCCAEVPRYLFYVSNLTMKTIPYPLFFVRYSAFMVLYPTGITGEIFQCLYSLSHWETALPVWFRGLKAILVLYAPGSPFMINNMWLNRKSAMKKRSAAANPRAASGLSWPVDKTGERGSTATNKAIFQAAVGAVSPALAEKVGKERNWRFGYVRHLEAQVRASLESTEAALKVAAAGLDKAQTMFEFIRGDKAVSLKEAMETYTEPTLETFTIKGGGAKAGKQELKIPYGGRFGKPYYAFKNRRDEPVSGAALVEQLDAWAANGVIEPDCAEALKAVSANPDWLDLSRHYFVLLGAGSAMGPLPLLLAMGANVYAVDIDRPGVWKRLIKMARESSGEFTFPIRASKLKGKAPKDMTDDELAEVAGCDLLNETPEIATWLTGCVPQKNVTIGNYTYLDGALHVQLSLACDAIISKLAEQRKDLALAFLCTPTDIHACSPDASAAARANLKQAPWWQKLALGKLLVPNALAPVKSAEGGELHYVDGVVGAQGPNYILAKRLQHWRSMIQFSRGHTISSNIAPSTATASVVHNAQFAAAYGGMHLFQPMEVMYAETSNAVMGALLVHDIRNPKAPARGGAKLDNPLHIFANGSFHGGTWRCGFKMGSIGELSAVTFYLKTYAAAISAGSAGFAAFALWLATGRVAFM